MQVEEIKLDEFSVVGISVVTTNAESKSLKDIGELWEYFFKNKIIEKIPNKLSEDIYCIYTDYESDFKGKYKTIIGCRVSESNNIPENLIKINIAASKYNKFVSKGEIQEAVSNTWNHIWSTNYPRTYLADFDIYTPKSLDPNLPEVETYLSIK